MAISAGETLSLNNLAGATGFTQSSNVSLGTIKGSPQAGDNISLSSFGVDSIDSINGFTYAVESTSEQYVIQFTGNGTNFNNKIRPRSANYTWSVSPSYNSAGNVSGYLDLPSSPAYNPTISIGALGSNLWGDTCPESHISATPGERIWTGKSRYVNNVFGPKVAWLYDNLKLLFLLGLYTRATLGANLPLFK